MNPREMPRHAWIGLIFFLAAFQFVIALIVAETRYPGYNAGANYISDLGAWAHPSAIVFNSSIIFFGALIVTGAWLMDREWTFRLVPGMFVLAGIAAIGVGIFNETVEPAHSIIALLAFLLSNLAVIVIGRYLRPPMSYVSYALGLIGLACVVLGMGFNVDLSLGAGGMERLFVYPVFGWLIAYGGALMASRDVITAKRRDALSSQSS
jgi:hypothetical membrane protein